MIAKSGVSLQGVLVLRQRFQIRLAEHLQWHSRLTAHWHELQ
jgi:hypothetical protein